VSEPASISSGIAARYATAFSSWPEDKALKALESGCRRAVDAALAASADLRAMIASPVYSREDQAGRRRRRRRQDGLSP
jgi:F-type H+-transporting ATPase subunit delta